MSDECRLSVGDIGEWRILRHHPFGLEFAARDRPEIIGIVDVIHISSDKSVAWPESFPPLDGVVNAIVLGYTPSGQLRLSTRDEDLSTE